MLTKKSFFLIYWRTILFESIVIPSFTKIISFFIEIGDIVCELQLCPKTIGFCERTIIFQRHPYCFFNLIVANFKVVELLWSCRHQASKVKVIRSIHIRREFSQPKDSLKVSFYSNLLEYLSLGALLKALSKVGSSSRYSVSAFEFSLNQLRYTLFSSISKMLLLLMSTPPQPT